MNLEGRQFGEFQILTRLGQGGMGAVYKARQDSLGRFVALKTLPPSFAIDEEYLGRFKREARAAAGLNHPNLVQVYSAGETDGLHWFAMEYVEGESAEARLKRKGRLDPLQAVAIAIHVATALEFAWRKAGLIHRDVKPDTIFLSSDGEVKLGDLGLAKSVGQTEDLNGISHAMGTPYYISPEQVNGTKDVDLRADIYSLGCTLYHLLSGELPIDGPSPVAIIMEHLYGPVPDLRSVWPECPVELSGVVRKMMSKSPAERPQSYAEVNAELRNVYDLMSGKSVRPVAPTRPPEVRPQANAEDPPQAIAPAQPLAVGEAPAAPAGTWWRLGALLQRNAMETNPSTKIVPASEEPKSGKTKLHLWIGLGVAVVALAVGICIIFQPRKNESGSTFPSPARATKDALTANEPAGAAPALLTDNKPVTSSPKATPAPSATPKVMTEGEKWLAEVDGPQQAAFLTQVVKPFEAGAADLQAHYAKSLDEAIAKASAAGQLEDALAWRKERQAFEKIKNVGAEDDGTAAEIKTLRAAFRQQLAKLDEDRVARAEALLDQYDAILAKNQILFTQRQRLDDALLLKTKREQIAIAWLAPLALTRSGPVDPLPSGMAIHPLLATSEIPFVNSLGMKFVPVPIRGGSTGGQQVLFGVWDTRVQDYGEFVNDTQREWPKPDFEQGPTHPAVNINWEDAELFCQWLTARERAVRRLPADWRYRLPSDDEWSCAVGLGATEDPAKSPAEKNQQISRLFPWGTQWPPPDNVGNFASEELKPFLAEGKYTYWANGAIPGYHDGYPTTSPVGSYPANRFGLFDMGGNVYQWCEDWYDSSRTARVERGSAWYIYNPDFLISSRRVSGLADRATITGFRCVLAPAR